MVRVGVGTHGPARADGENGREVREVLEGPGLSGPSCCRGVASRGGTLAERVEFRELVARRPGCSAVVLQP